MKIVSKLICTAGLVGIATTASAQVFSWTENVAIPDGDLNGTVITEQVSLPGATVSTNAFRVNLNIAGDPLGANGDLFIYLLAPNGTIVQLVNRPGVPTNGGLGYQDSGMNITLFDGSDPAGKTYTDIHFYQNDPVYTVGQGISGVFKTDGRDINPLSSGTVFENAGRTATLEGLQGIDPNGNWSLFMADVSSGGSSTLVSWGLDFTPIPEPEQYALALGVGLLGFALYRRRTLKAA